MTVPGSVFLPTKMGKANNVTFYPTVTVTVIQAMKVMNGSLWPRISASTVTYTCSTMMVTAIHDSNSQDCQLITNITVTVM